MSNPFQKASRTLSYLNVAITGPSGSGKTWSALEIATGMGGKIAVVDTENGSASLYSEFFKFDVLNVNPPFTQDKYIRAVKAAVESGYDIVVIDSFSHVWAGEGGAQEQKDALDARGGSKFANWAQPKAALKKVMSELLQSKIHVIATMRSKQVYAQVAGENGKAQIKKMGMDPIAEPGIEYEFTTVFDMDMAHQAQASKDRTHLFDGQTFKPTKETGVLLMSWRNTASHEVPPTPPQGKQVLPKQESAGNASAGSNPTVYTSSTNIQSSFNQRAPDTLGITDPRDYVVQKGKNGWAGYAIREIIEGFDGDETREPFKGLGLEKFKNDVDWLSNKSSLRGWVEIKHLRRYKDELVAEIEANHETNELDIALGNSLANDDFDAAYAGPK